jgi:hypothetical protein
MVYDALTSTMAVYSFADGVLQFPSARPAVWLITVDSPAFRKRPVAIRRGPRRNVSAHLAEPIVSGFAPSD